MRRVSGKNRLAIIALAVMIGVAGYMSFADAGKDKKTKKNGKEQVEVISYDEVAGGDSKNVADGSENIAADEAQDTDEGLSEDMELNGPEEEIGDAVLTSASAKAVTNNMASVKLTREQNRSKSRETLMDIIGDEALSDEAKKEAADTYVRLNDTIEMETDIETVLAAKGYTDVVVTIGDESVDVTLGAAELDDAERAQIEDIVTRKTGYNISNVAISMMDGK
ncbi:SpoIIIAH-like family protein [Coprococcus eutactus]|jgi:stage III sporulation protein AH|uniref:SpoIIIAH-like family protein n=1 Tax=Coprococcus eutactus TaxID=33043 RepID=A0A412IV23_9FIRM|nr:SpoIIIAH-like family protein [Coprococcus eutactus]MBT9731331.1 SpoIIIAH-like family protein [Coprococcus eutactus]RGS44031.1 SpoIIIAH-like family protein [Coprococcus eutactus]